MLRLQRAQAAWTLRGRACEPATLPTPHPHTFLYSLVWFSVSLQLHMDVAQGVCIREDVSMGLKKQGLWVKTCSLTGGQG